MSIKTVLGMLVVVTFFMGQGCTTPYNHTTLEQDQNESRKGEIKDKTDNTVQEENKQLY